MLQNTDLKARQSVISEIQGQYSSGKLRKREISNPIKEASAIWQEKDNTTETTDDIQTKIGNTLAKYVEYLNSDDSPFSQSERNNNDTSGLIEAIKPDGLLHNDLRNDKFESGDLRESFMKQFTNFMESVAEKSASGYQEEAKTALSVFPPQEIVEYNCVGGAKSRILEAERQLYSAQSIALTEGYTQARLNCNIESRKSVKTGNQVHINSAIDYLMGVAPSAIREVDPSFIAPVSQMSASVVWDSYSSTTGFSNQIKDTIISESKNAIADNEPDKNDLISQESQKQYFDAWKINVSDVLESFIDEEDYTTKRLPKKGGGLENNEELNERLGKEVAKAMSESLNKHIFGDDKKDLHVNWLEATEEKTNIPDVKKLSTSDGSQWVVDQLQACKPESGIENIGQEAALMSLFVFSEKMIDNKPAMAIKVLHELGGGGEEGINQGLEKLNSITSNNPNYSGVASKIQGRCNSLCQRGHNDGGIREYADYLKNPQVEPELLLHSMIAGGASDEEINNQIENASVKKMTLKDSSGNNTIMLLEYNNNLKAKAALSCKIDLLILKNTLPGEEDIGERNRMLNDAAMYNNVELMAALYEKDKNLKISISRNNDGREHENPIFTAIRSGSTDIINFLIDKDDECYKDRSLSEKLFSEHESVFWQRTYLNGSTGDYPSLLAMKTGNIDVLNCMYEKKPNIFREFTVKKTIEDRNFNSKNLDSLNWLKEKNPRALQNAIEYRDADNGTIMHSIVKYQDNVAAMKFIHNQNPEILRIKNNSKETPLHIAAKNGRIDTVKFLIEESKKNNQVDTDYLNSRSLFQRRTPLSKAVSKGHQNVVEELLKAGASKDLKDWRGRVPDAHAKKGNRVAEEKYQAIAALLNNQPNGGQDGGIGR